MLLTVTLNPSVDKSYYIDKLIPGEVNRVKEFFETPGGKGIQVAKVAKLLGGDVAATGFLGGRAGEYIYSFLKKEGIKVNFVLVEDETRTCININDGISPKQTEFLEPGAKISDEKKQEFLEKYAQLLNDCEIVSLSGSVPAGIDADFYPTLIRIAKKAGKTVILDTSGKQLHAGIDACPDVIKPNRTELAEYLDREINTTDEIIAAAQEIRSRGVKTVIVSLGKDGAVYVTSEGIYQGTTPDIPIINTVACGDSLVAGFATGLIRKLPITETIKLAMAVSTANALRKETGFFIREDLDKLLKMVDALELK